MSNVKFSIRTSPTFTTSPHIILLCIAAHKALCKMEHFFVHILLKLETIEIEKIHLIENFCCFPRLLDL